MKCYSVSARLEGKPCTKAYLTIFWDHLLNYIPNVLKMASQIYQLALHSFTVSIRWQLKVAMIS